jgi:prevent-host-death family protein
MSKVQTVGVRDLRQHLSRYLRRVAGGEVFRVSERGTPVALLGPLPEEAGAVERLLAQGRIREPRYDLLTLGPPPAQPVRTPISQALAAEREER